MMLDMTSLMPRTASVKEVQKNYRDLFDKVMETKEPLVILNNNKAEVVILDIKTYEAMADSIESYEHLLAERAIQTYESEKKSKKLKKLKSLRDLF